MSGIATEELQEQVLGAVRKSQEVTLEAVKRVVGTLSAATAKLPGHPLAEKIHAKLPQLPELPAADVVVDSAFDLAERLLADQHKFADELLKATAPLRPARAAADVPAADAPVTDAPVADVPVTDAPATDAPAAE
jgi:hypothetical protein